MRWMQIVEWTEHVQDRPQSCSAEEEEWRRQCRSRERNFTLGLSLLGQWIGGQVSCLCGSPYMVLLRLSLMGLCLINGVTARHTKKYE
jgi:hypothetical protein